MNKEIEFDVKAICDSCGKKGCYDFHGNKYCPECAELLIDTDEPENEE